MGEVFCRFAKEKESHYGVSYAGVLGFQGICDGFAEEYFCLKNPNAVDYSLSGVLTVLSFLIQCVNLGEGFACL